MAKISNILNPRVMTNLPHRGSLYVSRHIDYIHININNMLGRMSWTWIVAHMVDNRIVYRVLVGRPEGNSPLGRHRRNWNDNIKLDLQEVGWRVVNCTDLVQNRDRWRAVMNAVIAGNF